VSRYQKGKPIWILLKQETVSGSDISWAICKSAHRSRQITTPAPHHSFFYRPDALPAAQPTASNDKDKDSPYSITERRVVELIPVLGSQPAGDVSHKPGGRMPLLSARPAVTPATLKRAAASFAAW